MNFWRYTFTGKFLNYAAIAISACIVAALPLYILNEIRLVQIIFSTYATIFLGNVASRFYHWRKYMSKRAKGLLKRADKSRSN